VNVETKPISVRNLTQAVQKTVSTQQQKSMRLLTYLINAQKEVLEFEIGVLEDVLKILTKTAPTAKP
jgi:thiamine phosphate synthase YjbQ (UPF0047 family)